MHKKRKKEINSLFRIVDCSTVIQKVMLIKQLNHDIEIKTKMKTKSRKNDKKKFYDEIVSAFIFVPLIRAVIYQVHVQLVTCCSNVVEYWSFHY